MAIETCDCIVLGGGPAGSTFAAIAKKYSSGSRVILLEKDRFPRWRMAESTHPAANHVLKELGVYESLLSSGFVKNVGVTFIWGSDRTPWSRGHPTHQTLATSHGGATSLSLHGSLWTGNRQDMLTPAFHVARSRFDKILLDNAKALGAQAREGTRATHVRRIPGTSSHAVCWEDDQGQTGEIRAGFVLDATGCSQLVAKGPRVRNDTLTNFAVAGFLSGAEWAATCNGSRDRSIVFIATVDKGWIWYFPLGRDLMSAGAVTNTRHFDDGLRGVDPERFFWEMLYSCPEVSGLVTNARLRDDILPEGERVYSRRDWPCWALEPVGDGWAAAGGALMFVDPIVSGGVTQALQTGHRAAYTWLMSMALPDAARKALWRGYADCQRSEREFYIKLARELYASNTASRSWFWQAQRLANAPQALLRPA